MLVETKLRRLSLNSVLDAKLFNGMSPRKLRSAIVSILLELRSDADAGCAHQVTQRRAATYHSIKQRSSRFELRKLVDELPQISTKNVRNRLVQ